ncbi:UNC93-like protein MFSD11 isoform X2 [Paramacrobiotus metropolitanus]|uniref:UNC93-like protein MFSD11 isoform X2 n=1 Tax=Paramacrobiotus metropolitanus TaxID=2943436 RepID=UPI002445C6CE|nr:UNC93-like protein MFSD11 isoform X2 [Paramacrobiotus metropolitanus]
MFPTWMAQAVVLYSVNDEYFEASTTFGYTLWAISSGVACVAVLVAPSIVALVGPKVTLITGGICTTLYVAAFIRPLKSTMYMAAVFVTLGSTLMWQVQGHFITVNSTNKRVSRNTGIFLALYQSSLVLSNLFYFFMLNGDEVISPAKRIQIFSILTAAATIGVIVLTLLVHPWLEKIPRPPAEVSVDKQEAVQAQPSHRTPGEAFYAMLQAMRRKDIMILIPVFFYLGIEGSFWSIYATALGYTERFGSLQQALVGLTSVFAGAGEIIAGTLVGLLGKWMHYNGKDGILVIGMLVHIVMAYMTFLNTPMIASTTVTSDKAFVGPNAYIAMLISFMLGLGDGIFNGQIIGYLGSAYRHDCVSVFAVCNFWAAIGSTVAFLYAALLLPYQLLILILVAIAGTTGFCIVEWKNFRKPLPLA